jgi:hypothetical protein
MSVLEPLSATSPIPPSRTDLRITSTGSTPSEGAVTQEHTLATLLCAFVLISPACSSVAINTPHGNVSLSRSAPPGFHECPSVALEKCARGSGGAGLKDVLGEAGRAIIDFGIEGRGEPSEDKACARKGRAVASCISSSTAI